MKINSSQPTNVTVTEISKKHVLCLHCIYCLSQYFIEAQLDSETIEATGILPVFAQQAAAAKTIQYLNTHLYSSLENMFKVQCFCNIFE